ncbi:DUF3187 family protein [Geoalkalibacter halelectricus]|uniref:DUF3187 family protein n=1 Tax=Geoalkalibacter halelectricus TaxID=2847045 RepID=A0ABY5ZHG5_9BACT|nr:DUF3187 family protein [Geoalkalibacter halelectricus]MDO3379672.1 DUF3187 family protein [Geoalkalibacter halelectricus]UWZ78513.1 DUF3187 family protein [Geoalkalibacter halelectricus]
MPVQRLFLLGVLCLCLGLPEPLRAAEVLPFHTRNLQPTVQIFGLPAAEGGRITPPGKTRGRLVLETANNFTGGRGPGEGLEFDGETYRMILALRRGLASGWEAGIDLSLVGHHGGGLDRLIERWHDLLGVGKGGRHRRARNRLFYFYQKDGQREIDVRENNLGIGDWSLVLARPLFKDHLAPGRALALRSGIKFPTGNPDRLHGSGSVDMHARLTYSDAETLKNIHLTLFASGGILAMTRGEVMPAQQRSHVWFGSAGLGWKPWQRVALKAQVDGHSAFFRGSSLREIKAPSAQLVLGGSYYLSERWILDLAVSEDIVVDSAPDVAFHLALTRHF